MSGCQIVCFFVELNPATTFRAVNYNGLFYTMCTVPVVVKCIRVIANIGYMKLFNYRMGFAILALDSGRYYNRSLAIKAVSFLYKLLYLA